MTGSDRETAAGLFRAATAGSLITLAVLVTEGMMIALDEVVVSAASAGTVDAHVAFTLDAAAVRFI